MNDLEKYKKIVIEDIKWKFLNVMLKYVSGVENTEQIQRVFQYQLGLLEDSFKSKEFDDYVQEYKNKVEYYNNICEEYLGEESSKELNLPEKVSDSLKETYQFSKKESFNKVEEELLEIKRKIQIYKSRVNNNHMCFFSSGVSQISPFIEKQLISYNLGFEANALTDSIEGLEENIKKIRTLSNTVFLDSVYVTNLMKIIGRLPFAFKESFFEHFQENFVMPSGGYDVLMGRRILNMRVDDMVNWLNIENTYSKNVFLFLNTITPALNVDKKCKEKFVTILPKLLEKINDKLNAETLASFYVKAMTICNDESDQSNVLINKDVLFKKMMERKNITGENMKFNKMVMNGESDNFIKKMKNTYLSLMIDFEMFELNQKRDEIFQKIKNDEVFNPFGIKKARVIVFDIEKLLEYSLFEIRDLDSEVVFKGQNFEMSGNKGKSMKSLSLFMADIDLLSDNEILLEVIKTLDIFKKKRINKHSMEKDEFSTFFENFIREQILLKKFEGEKENNEQKKPKI